MASIPWEKRPLSRRGVLGWTIGTMIGAVLIGTTVAVALARSASHSAASVAPHGAETADIVPAERPAAPSAAQSEQGIPPSALPKVEKAKPRNTATRASHHEATRGTTGKKSHTHASKATKAKPNATAR